ncbi:MAG: Fic family protein [Blastocatellia bacterium]
MRTRTILFTRPTHEWIGRVNQKHKELGELHLAEKERATLDRWIETEFVYSTLLLDEVDITREQVSRIVSPPVSAAVGDWSDQATALLESLRAVTSLARAHGRAAALTVDLLQTLHNIPDATGGLPVFRKNAGDSAGPVKPVAPEHLAAVLESACQWYTVESFMELHPVEQASIVFLRLIGIQPFEQANERTALVAASLFTLRNMLPPIIIKPEMRSAYRNAIDEGTKINTKPMVELVAEAVEQALSQMIEQAKREG